MTSLTLTKARDGGFYVSKGALLNQSPYPEFAGSLSECLDYMENEILCTSSEAATVGRGGAMGYMHTKSGDPIGRYQTQGNQTAPDRVPPA